MSLFDRPYRPRPGSLADMVCSYFRTHPSEELGAADIVVKFEAQRSGITANLRRPLDYGWLERFRAAGDEQWSYRAGPNLPQRKERVTHDE